MTNMTKEDIISAKFIKDKILTHIIGKVPDNGWLTFDCKVETDGLYNRVSHKLILEYRCLLSDRVSNTHSEVAADAFHYMLFGGIIRNLCDILNRIDYGTRQEVRGLVRDLLNKLEGRI